MNNLEYLSKTLKFVLFKFLAPKANLCEFVCDDLVRDLNFQDFHIFKAPWNEKLIVH